ncbi:MAG: 5-(carboxyamino)imidazole ribonucleotide mutase [Mycoplasmoidaceae bacterium]
MKKIAIIMGSKNDYEHLKSIFDLFDKFKYPYDILVVSAHRTPKWMFEFAESAHEKYLIILAAAGGSAHLPGMVASITVLPVIAIPIKSQSFNGIDAILSMIQMPNGSPVATIGLDRPINAALLALKILALSNDNLRKQLIEYKNEIKEEVLKNKLIKNN